MTNVSAWTERGRNERPAAGRTSRLHWAADAAAHVVVVVVVVLIAKNEELSRRNRGAFLFVYVYVSILEPRDDDDDEKEEEEEYAACRFTVLVLHCMAESGRFCMISPGCGHRWSK